jgi:hypothetical protein
LPYFGFAVSNADKIKYQLYNKMENNCDTILKIMKESFNQIEGYKNKRYNVIIQTIEEKIEIDKIKTMNIANYLKSVEVYSLFCNKDK